MLPDHYKLTDALKHICDEKLPILTLGNLHGLERECLRVDLNAKIAQTPHPEILGASLTHPSITTDFSESQIEFTTQPYATIQESLQELESLQNFVCNTLEGELLWPMSMPAILPKNEKDIPLAKYGQSREGLKKTIYRRGLGNRYGRRMQTISGVHYNYSFGKPLLDFLQTFYPQQNFSTSGTSPFKTQIYFHTIRNFFRNTYFIPYLFGASNAIDDSFFYDMPEMDSRLLKSSPRTWMCPKATSLRMSQIGYTNHHQDQLFISYENLSSYTKGLEHALSTHCSEYEKFSIADHQQLNSNLLQIENEYYSILRPKPDLRGYTSSLKALKDRGVEYIEIRGLDLSPTLPFAVDEHRMAFIHMLLLDCLFQPSPTLERQEKDELQNLFDEVVWNGQNTKTATHRLIRTRGLQLVERLEKLAILLDQETHSNLYETTLKQISAVFNDPACCANYHTMNSLFENRDMVDLGLEIAKTNCNYFRNKKLSDQVYNQYIQTAKDSLQKQYEIEQNEALFVS